MIADSFLSSLFEAKVKETVSICTSWNLVEHETTAVDVGPCDRCGPLLGVWRLWSPE